MASNYAVEIAFNVCVSMYTLLAQKEPTIHQSCVQ